MEDVGIGGYRESEPEEIYGQLCRVKGMIIKVQRLTLAFPRVLRLTRDTREQNTTKVLTSSVKGMMAMLLGWLMDGEDVLLCTVIYNNVLLYLEAGYR